MQKVGEVQNKIAHYRMTKTSISIMKKSIIWNGYRA